MKKIRFWKEAFFLGIIWLVMLGSAGSQEDKNFTRFLETPKDFDGVTDALTVSLPDAARLYRKLTVSVWVYPRTPEGAITARAVVAQDSIMSISVLPYDGDIQKNPGKPGKLTASIYAGGSYKSVTSALSLLANKWSHVAMTYDQEYLRLFLDGKEAATLKENGALIEETYPRPLGIGRPNTWVRHSFWAGLLSDVRIYGTALEPGEIAKLASSPPPPPDPSAGFRSDLAKAWVLNGGCEGEYTETYAGKSVPDWWVANTWGPPVVKTFKETDNPHSGKTALKLECTDFPGSVTSSGMSISNSAAVPLVPGCTYTLDVWLRSDSDVKAYICIAGGPGKEVQTERRWKKYSVSALYSGAPALGSVVIYYQEKRPGDLAIDDVSVSVE